MKRKGLAVLGMVLACVPLAACGDDDTSEAAAGGTPPEDARPFRVYSDRYWGSPIIVGSKAVMVGKTVENGSEARVRIGDTTEPALGGTSPGHVMAIGKDDSSVIVGLRPCEAIGPNGGSSGGDTTCIEYGSHRLIEYDLDDRTTTEVSVPDDLQRLLDASHRVDLDAYADETLFVSVHDGNLFTEVRWDLESDTFLSSPIDTNSSADVWSTCVTDDGVRYDTVITNGSVANFIDGLEEGPTHVERRASTGERTVMELPEPAGDFARWETVCVGTSGFVAAGGTMTGLAAYELDSEVLDPSEVFGPPADTAGPQPPAKILQLPDLAQVSTTPSGQLSTETGSGGVFSDGYTVELLEEDGSLRRIPWMPPGIASTDGDVLTITVTTESTPDTSVIVDLDEYDEAAAAALRDQLYG